MEDQQAVREEFDEEILPVFDVLVQQKAEQDKRTRNRVKKVAAELLDAIKKELAVRDGREQRVRCGSG